MASHDFVNIPCTGLIRRVRESRLVCGMRCRLYTGAMALERPQEQDSGQTICFGRLTRREVCRLREKGLRMLDRATAGSAPRIARCPCGVTAVPRGCSGARLHLAPGMARGKRHLGAVLGVAPRCE